MQHRQEQGGKNFLKTTERKKSCRDYDLNPRA